MDRLILRKTYETFGVVGPHDLDDEYTNETYEKRLKDNRLIGDILDDGNITSNIKETDYIYEIDEKEAKITGYNGNEQNLIVPAQIEGIDVVEICPNAFTKSKMKSVIIPDTVKCVFRGFVKCNKLETVICGDGLDNMWDRAFFSCHKLKSISLGKNFKIIESVKEIMEDCPRFEQFTVAEDNNLRALDGVLYSKDMKKLVMYPSGKKNNVDAENIIIPEGIKRVGDGAFVGKISGLIVSPESVKYIGNWAFSIKGFRDICMRDSLYLWILKARIQKNS